jgi:hypothetical protein
VGFSDIRSQETIIFFDGRSPKSMNSIFVWIIVLLSTIFPAWLIAQGKSDFGISINGGLSYMRTDMNSGGTKQTFYVMPSYHAGFYWNTYYWEKSFIGMSGYLVEIQGREHSTTEQLDFYGNPNGQFNTSDTRRRISYWSMLFNYGHDFKKFNLSLGIQFNVMYKMYAHDRTEISYNGGIIINEYKSDALPIDSYDYALRAGLIYNLTTKFSIEATYFHGLRDICIIDNWTWTVQQVTVGLRYNLFAHEGRIPSGE